MSRDLTVTPRRLTYAEEQELEIMEHFRSISPEEGAQIVSEAVSRTEKVLEVDFEGQMTLSGNNNTVGIRRSRGQFEEKVNELDRKILDIISQECSVVLSEFLKLADSGPLQRCLHNLEEKVTLSHDEAPSLFLKKLINAGDNHLFSPLDGLSTSYAITRKFKLLLNPNLDLIDEEWKKNHVNSFLANLCVKKLGAAFVEMVKGNDIFHANKNI